jgi:hypothetical protein
MDEAMRMGMLDKRRVWREEGKLFRNHLSLEEGI